MKIEWMSPQDTTETDAVAFGFDTVEQVMSGQVTVFWLKAGANPLRKYNLVISDTGANAEALGQAVIKAADKTPKHLKGETNDGTARDVYPIFNDPMLPFRAGLTVHAARGTWSSLPHKFEAEEILTPRPMPFYEKFAYVTDPPGGWGVQVRIGHLYSDMAEVEREAPPDDDYNIRLVNQVGAIRDRDILDIPLGSHPVTGGAGVRLAYFWVYWGSLEGREKF